MVEQVSLINMYHVSRPNPSNGGCMRRERARVLYHLMAAEEIRRPAKTNRAGALSGHLVSGAETKGDTDTLGTVCNSTCVTSVSAMYSVHVRVFVDSDTTMFELVHLAVTHNVTRDVIPTKTSAGKAARKLMETSLRLVRHDARKRRKEDVSGR